MCVCVHVHVGMLNFKERCLSMYFHVPSAHLALVTAPVTCVWFCSIPAPIAPLWESRVMTECCCSSQDPWRYGCSLLCSRLDTASCWPVCYFFPRLCLQNNVFFLKRERVKPVVASARHVCHPQDTSAETLIHALLLSSEDVGLWYYHCGSQHWLYKIAIIGLTRCGVLLINNLKT